MGFIAPRRLGVKLFPSSPGTGDTGITHITGAFPDDGENSIIAATGIFEGAVGAVRLSGAANLSRLGDAGEMGFACLFVIQLEGNFEV